MPVNTTEERLELTAVDRASSVIRGVGKSFTDLRTGIDATRSSLVSIGATLGVAAMAKFTTDVIRAAAALDDMSEATGSSVENLSRMQVVARIGGHDFAGLSTAMGNMVRGLKGANEEGQNAGRALAFLGVSAKDSSGQFRDTGELLTDVAKALAQYEDGGNKVALVQDLLGKSGAQYLSYLKDLAKEGNVAARVTTEQAQKAEELQKNINRLTQGFVDMKTELGLGLMPIMSDFVEQMNEGIRIFGGFGSALLNLGTINPFKNITENIAQMRGHLEAIEKLRSMGVPTGDPETLRKRIEFLQFMQRQEAMRLATPDTLDARDRALREMNRPKALGYESGGPNKDAEKELARIMAERQRLLAEDAANWVRHIEEGLRASEDLVFTWNEAGERVTMTRKEWERIIELQERGQQIFSDALIQPLVEAAQAAVDAAEDLVYTYDSLGNAITMTTREFRDREGWAQEDQDRRIREDIERSRALNEDGRRAADTFEQAVYTGIMAGFRRGGGGLADELQRALQGAVFTALIGPIASSIGEQFRPLGSALASGNWSGVGSAFAGSSWTTPGSVYEDASGNVSVTPGGFNWGGAVGPGLMGLAALQQYASAGSSANPAGQRQQSLLTFAGMGAGAFFGPMGAMVGGAAGGMLGSLFGNDDGPTGRSAQIGGQFGAPTMFGNQWFGRGTESVPDYLQELGRREEMLISRLGITPEQMASINARVSGSQTYGFGQEWTPWEQSGAAERIAADRLKAVSETLGRSIEELTTVMSLSSEQWEEAIRNMERAIQASEFGVGNFALSLPGQLGITGLEEFQRSLAVSEANSPLDRLGAARSQFDELRERALSGDRDAIFGFAGSAQQLLGIGRDVYASGAEYQSLFSDVNKSLSEVLERQREEQADLMSGLDVSMTELRVQWLAELRVTKTALVEQLEALRSDLRKMQPA